MPEYYINGKHYIEIKLLSDKDKSFSTYIKLANNISFTLGDRARMIPELKMLTLNVDNIWCDTQNFDNFIEGLKTVILTEFMCLCECDFDSDNCYCMRHPGTDQYGCIFIQKANEILGSNYNLCLPHIWEKEVLKREELWNAKNVRENLE